MDQENFNIKIMITIKEILKIIKKMVMVFIFGVMEINMKDYGRIIKDKVQEFLLINKEINLKEILLKIQLLVNQL